MEANGEAGEGATSQVNCFAAAMTLMVQAVQVGSPGVVQLIRTSACHAGCRGFESLCSGTKPQVCRIVDQDECETFWIGFHFGRIVIRQFGLQNYTPEIVK